MTASDAAVIVLSAVLVGAAYGAFWQPRTPGAFVAVHDASGAVHEYALNETLDLTVPGRLGDSHLRVEGGRIRFSDSPCKGRVCVHKGWIGLSGEVAACVPNGVFAEIRGETRAYDTLNF